MDEKLSIIIPAHNCEATLRQAVASIYDDLSTEQAAMIQTIIVENGSQDQTPQVAQQIVKVYPQVCLTHSQPGVSKARNQGLKVATGQALLFLDADDYFKSGMVKQVLEYGVKADLSIYSFESGKALKRLFDQATPYQQADKEQLIATMLENPTNYLTVWGKVFRRQLILDHQLFFNEDLRFSEDSLFVLQYLLVVQTALGLPTVLYHYNRAENSAVRSFDEEKVAAYLQALEVVNKLIQNSLPDVLPSFYIYGLMQVNLIGVHGIYDVKNSAAGVVKKAQLKAVVQDPIVAECLKRTPLTRMRAPKFAAIILLKLHCYALAGKVFTLRSRAK